MKLHFLFVGQGSDWGETLSYNWAGIVNCSYLLCDTRQLPSTPGGAMAAILCSEGLLSISLTQKEARTQNLYKIGSKGWERVFLYHSLWNEDDRVSHQLLIMQLLNTGVYISESHICTWSYWRAFDSPTTQVPEYPEHSGIRTTLALFVWHSSFYYHWDSHCS